MRYDQVQIVVHYDKVQIVGKIVFLALQGGGGGHNWAKMAVCNL